MASRDEHQLVELAIENATRAIVERCADVLEAKLGVTACGPLRRRLRSGSQGISIRAVLVEKASHDSLWLMHRFHRKAFEEPALDPATWLHAVVAVVSPDPPLGTWWSESLLPAFEVLIANWPHRALAIVPAVMTEHGPGVDESIRLPPGYTFEALVETAVRHLTECELRDGVLFVGSLQVDLTAQEQAVLRELARVAEDRAMATVKYGDLVSSPDRVDALRGVIKRLVPKLKKAGVDGLLEPHRGGVRLARRLRCL